MNKNKTLFTWVHWEAFLSSLGLKLPLTSQLQSCVLPKCHSYRNQRNVLLKYNPLCHFYFIFCAFPTLLFITLLQNKMCCWVHFRGAWAQRIGILVWLKCTINKNTEVIFVKKKDIRATRGEALRDQSFGKMKISGYQIQPGTFLFWALTFIPFTPNEYRKCLLKKKRMYYAEDVITEVEWEPFSGYYS